MRAPSGLGSRRRSPPRGPVSTPTTRQDPAIRASSISLARTRRAPCTLISWRSSTSRFSSTSSGRRSKWRRSSLALRRTTPSGPMCETRSTPEIGGPSGDRHQKAGDRRVADAAEAHDHVAHLAQALAVGVAQGTARHGGQVQDRRRLRGGRVVHSAHRRGRQILSLRPGCSAAAGRVVVGRRASGAGS